MNVDGKMLLREIARGWTDLKRSYVQQVDLFTCDRGMSPVIEITRV